MKMERASWPAKLARGLSKPLSNLAAQKQVGKAVRSLEAYLALIQGKGCCGCGTSWSVRYEPDAAARLVKKADGVVFDVGAHHGDWSKQLREVLPEAQLFLFEPTPDGCRRIEESKLENAELIRSAVGKEEGKATFFVYQKSMQGNSLIHRGDSSFTDKECQEIEVEVITLDAFTSARGIEYIDFLKLDIEGAELDALMGAKRLLAEKRIGALSFEFGMTHVSGRSFFRDFWNLLTEHDFEIFRINASGNLLPVTAYYEDLEYFRGVSNYFARNRSYGSKDTA